MAAALPIGKFENAANKNIQHHKSIRGSRNATRTQPSVAATVATTDATRTQTFKTRE
jgi:hypothetical protein